MTPAGAVSFLVNPPQLKASALSSQSPRLLKSPLGSGVQVPSWFMVATQSYLQGSSQSSFTVLGTHSPVFSSQKNSCLVFLQSNWSHSDQSPFRTLQSLGWHTSLTHSSHNSHSLPPQSGGGLSSENQISSSAFAPPSLMFFILFYWNFEEDA